MANAIRTLGFELQASPKIYVTALPGRWLLNHSTPSWRIKDPKRGFQRIVREERARKIAAAVLAQHRTFPNAIVLATDATAFHRSNGHLSIPSTTRLLVVDGQHRLWAQRFSSFQASYGCVIHMGLTEVGMAQLFLEINDNQKRVPSSLRWDLVRLVRPDDDPYTIGAAELVLELNTDETSPLFQRIDLTGEQPEISLKQGSLAPELKTLLSTQKGRFFKLGYEKQYEILIRYLAAIRALDTAGWKRGTSAFYKARVLRALIRLLPEIIEKMHKPAESISTADYRRLLDRVDRDALAPDAIRAAQGSAGMNAIYMQLKAQVLN